jgi:hypothetical protein
MANLNGFNANEVEPTSFDVLPVGEYDACLVDSEMKATSKGGKMLVLKLQILNGPYQNRLLWDRLNLENASSQTVEIARSTLADICKAVGVTEPKDSVELHNKPLKIKVGIRPAKGEFSEQNQVKSYKPRQSGPVAPVAAPVSQPVSTPATDADATPWG